MRPSFALFPTLLAAACTGNKGLTGVDTGSGGDGGIVVDDTGEGDAVCGETVPVIESGPFCDYQGMLEPEPGTGAVPTLRIWSNTHDDDGDLHYRAVRLWFDGEPLGEIDVETAELKEKARTRASDRDCEIEDATPSDKWFLYEGRVEYGADYDWGMSVQDAAGNWSEMAVTTCPAPTEKGLEP